MSEAIIRVGCASLNQTPLDWEGNSERIVQAICAARKLGVGVLCLPELCVSGYGCEDMFLAPWVTREAMKQVIDVLAPQSKGIAVAVGLPVERAGCRFNCMAMLCDGTLVGISAKQFLANDGIHYERRWFDPWTGGTATLEFEQGERVPFGELVFSFGGIRAGFEICEDAWVEERPGLRLSAAGASLVLNPSASHFAFGKREVREGLVLEGSRSFGANVLFANLLGNEAGRAIYDGSTLIASGGRVVAEGARFSFHDHTLCTADVKVDPSRTGQASFGGVVDVPFVVPETGGPATTALASRGRRDQNHEFCRAASLGLFDYLRKARAKGYVISLSGGVDSAACAVLVAHMVRASLAELGQAGLRERLSDVPLGQDPDRFVRELLVTVYQATSSSSDITRDAAREVAMALGAEHHLFDVEPIVAQYRAHGEATLGRPVQWETDDVPLQNIQARVRAPGVWLVANLRGMLLCSTGNRSEASLGYMTMDGDTAGGVSPIAGVDKNFLRSWLRWMESSGVAGFGPIPALSAVNQQEPSAELRPSRDGEPQKDEEELMPFEILDALERLFLVERSEPGACLAQLCAAFPQRDPLHLEQWTERFFRLWTQNQWKRERLAPSFHLDGHSVDPKSWCRFPILNGGLPLKKEPRS